MVIYTCKGSTSTFPSTSNVSGQGKDSVVATIYQENSSCGYVGLDIGAPLFDCLNGCGVFNKSQSSNRNHQCPQCHKFGTKLKEYSGIACPNCQVGELEGQKMYCCKVCHPVNTHELVGVTVGVTVEGKGQAQVEGQVIEEGESKEVGEQEVIGTAVGPFLTEDQWQAHRIEVHSDLLPQSSTELSLAGVEEQLDNTPE